MEDIITALRPKRITKDWIMERIVQMGSSTDVIDIFMRCITWNVTNIESDTIEGVGKRQQSVANFFMDTNPTALFLVITKCGNKLQSNSMVRYLFLVLKKHWEAKVYRFVLESRKNINEQNYTERSEQSFDGTEEPMSAPPSVNRTLSTAEKQAAARLVSSNMRSPLYANEWKEIKEYRKRLLSQLNVFSKYVSSWNRPDDFEVLVEEFGKFLQNTLHINTQAVVYSTLKNAFVDMIENTGKLVDYNGIGADPLFLKFNRPTTISPKEVSNLNGKMFRYLRQGYLDRWYAWAAQWWLARKHSKWFMTVCKTSKSDDQDMIKRGAELVLMDETARGASRYCMYGLVSLNYPSLRYIRVFRNNDPWYVPPEMLENKISTECTVKISNGNSDMVRQKLLTVKKYAKNLNTVFYTSNFDYLGFCFVKNIPLSIENGECVSIASLREQVLRLTIVGPMTRYVKDETRILTYAALMLISSSHGLPLYVSMGWDSVMAQWNTLLKENSGTHRPSMANKTCSWLARRVNTGIVLNQPLLYALFVRLLNRAFTPDKRIAKGDMNDGYINYLKKHYIEMKEEGRIGSGKVKPCTVTKMWNPFSVKFAARQQREISSKNASFLDSAVDETAQQAYKDEKMKLEQQLENIYNNRDFQGELKTNEETIQKKRREIVQTEATIRDLERQLGEELKNPSLTIPMFTSRKNELTNSISASTERIRTIEGDIIKLQKAKTIILQEQMETNIQIKRLRDQISNLPPPTTGRQQPLWNQNSYAPNIEAPFTQEEKKLIGLETYEWMYAQRLRFVNEYYAPVNIDKLVEKFRIRFKDWTGESNISINL